VDGREDGTMVGREDGMTEGAIVGFVVCAKSSDAVIFPGC